MILTKLNDLLQRNDVSIVDLNGAIYKTIILSVFETICIQMKNKEIRQKVLSNMRNSRNQLLYVEQLAIEMSGCTLSQEESKELLDWLIAYFRKNNTRIKYPLNMRKEMLKKQMDSCNICKIKINLKSSELDHIIPWDFVGDELQNNLQLLCCNCNERKGRRIHFQLNMFLINHRKSLLNCER